MTATKPGPGADPAATWTRQQKVTWCKARAADCPWESAMNSMIGDMDLLGIPLSRAVIELGTLEGMRGGERAVREYIDGIR